MELCQRLGDCVFVCVNVRTVTAWAAKQQSAKVSRRIDRINGELVREREREASEGQRCVCVFEKESLMREMLTGFVLAGWMAGLTWLATHTSLRLVLKLVSTRRASSLGYFPLHSLLLLLLLLHCISKLRRLAQH